MQKNNNGMHQSRVRRRVNDLVMAEMFLVQATIESAAAIGDGLNELGRHIAGNEEGEASPWDSISEVLQRTREEALEPYTSRYKYFREMVAGERNGHALEHRK